MGAAVDFAALMGAPQDLPPAVPVAVKPFGKTGQTKRIWLLLYAEGGRWTSAEIRDRLHVRGNLYVALRDMVGYRLLVRSNVETPEGMVIKYGVGKGCKVPRDVTVDEMWDVLQIGGRQ